MNNKAKDSISTYAEELFEQVGIFMDVLNSEKGHELLHKIAKATRASYAAFLNEGFSEDQANTLLINSLSGLKNIRND